MRPAARRPVRGSEVGDLFRRVEKLDHGQHLKSETKKESFRESWDANPTAPAGFSRLSPSYSHAPGTRAQAF